MNDEFSAKTTAKLIEEGEQPDFMMVFLPDFDKKAHKYRSNNPESIFQKRTDTFKPFLIHMKTGTKHLRKQHSSLLATTAKIN
ncbi:hypothetical protein GN156_09610 [bacterium LRH843]|nr:hypothetical protein [bacterium LRH843]